MRADVTAAFPGDHEAGIRVLGEARPRRRVPARLLRLASDERLVEHVRGGSEAAFEALFDRHHRGVLGFCRHMLGSVEEAEDAVQHTFLAAHQELVGSTKHVQLRPWLYTIARNRCLTMLRGRRHVAGREVQDPPTEHLAAEVERRVELRSLLRDVAALPEDQRAALVLSELGDMSHDEIADVIGCRREKVKALVFQARSSLLASRAARETPCAEIREQLANLRGGSLRRNEVRRHVSECPGCREFRDQVRAQRRDLALVLPVAPTVGLKSAVIGGAAAGSSAAAVGAGGAGTGALAAKVLVAAAIAGGGTVAVENEISRAPAAPEQSRAPAVKELRGSGAAAPPALAPAHTTPRAASHESAPGRTTGPRERAVARGERAKPDKEAKVHGKRGHDSAPGQLSKQGNGPKVGQGKSSAPGQASKPTNGKSGQTSARGRASAPGQILKPAKSSGNGSKPLKAAKPEKASKPLKPAKASKPVETKPVEAVEPGKAAPDKPAKPAAPSPAAGAQQPDAAGGSQKPPKDPKPPKVK